MKDFFTKLIAVFTTTVHDDSPQGVVNQTDWAKIVRDVVLSMAGAGVAVLLDDYKLIDLGNYQSLIGPFIFAGLQFVQKKLKDNTAVK